MTNTNWQAYSGEASLSYFSQMVGLTTQNFVSAATGAAVAIALFRGIARQQTTHLGNFWQDLVRFCLYVLLPMALILALLLVWQGVPQSLSAYLPFHALEGRRSSCCRSARPPPRSPSSSSAPTVVASSASTRLIRLKTRPPSPTGWRWSPC